MKVLHTIDNKEKTLTKVLLGNGILLVTPANKTMKILEESKYEQIAKENFCLWRSSLSPLKLNTTTLGMTRTRLKSVTSSNQSLDTWTVADKSDSEDILASSETVETPPHHSGQY